jgi:hypothetical protein
MNIFGVFAVFVLLYVIYQFLSSVYHSARRHYREGFKPNCKCNGDKCRNAPGNHSCRCGNNCI